jgi:hypothetical protein
MNSTQAQQEAVRRWGPLGSVVCHFTGLGKPFWVGTALCHGADFTFHCFGRGDSWEAAFTDAETKQLSPFHEHTAEAAR